MWETSLQIELLLRVLLAALCGSAIGFERGFRRKEAGQRTHCVIAIGACTFMILSAYAFPDYPGNLDLTQIACQIVCGLGFLGVGIIYKSDTFGISGLSTATGLWATAAIGMACGIGMYGLSIAVTVFLILFHIFLNVTNMESFGYTIQTVTIEIDNIETIRPLLRKKRNLYRANLLSYEYTRNEDRGTITVSFRFRMLGAIPLKDVLKFLREHDGIRTLST